MELSIVVPTYNEKENIVELISKIKREFLINKINGEIIVVDDNSPDGTGKILDSLSQKEKMLKVVHRSGKLGLSSAVLDGWKASDANVLGVMDADFSHPIEKIKELFFAIKKDNADLAIGSRHVKGGKIIGWSLKRKIMSKTATLLARPYTNIKDPMSGFFMVKKKCLKDVDINPRGFKILLEVVLKAKCKKIVEVPIIFVDRMAGKSKAGFKEIFYYIRNLLGYGKHIRKELKEFFKFCVVGAVGTIINLSILYILTEKLFVYYLTSAIFSFMIAMTSNFVLNKVWTFGENIKVEIGKKYLQFGLISILALLINLLFLYVFTEIWGIYYMISQVLSIGIALIINFIGNKIWTFSK